MRQTDDWDNTYIWEIDTVETIEEMVTIDTVETIK